MINKNVFHFSIAISFCFRITNLKYWGRSEQIISKTLQLLNDLSVGYSCVRKLVKLEEVQFMLNNHTVSTVYALFYLISFQSISGLVVVWKVSHLEAKNWKALLKCTKIIPIDPLFFYALVKQNMLSGIWVKYGYPMYVSTL